MIVRSLLLLPDLQVIKQNNSAVQMTTEQHLLKLHYYLFKETCAVANDWKCLTKIYPIRVAILMFYVCYCSFYVQITWYLPRLSHYIYKRVFTPVFDNVAECWASIHIAYITFSQKCAVYNSGICKHTNKNATTKNAPARKNLFS